MNVQIGNGEVRLIRRQKFFLVSYTVLFEQADIPEEAMVLKQIPLTVRIDAAPATPYTEVERAAAAKLAPLLRQVADSLADYVEQTNE